MTTKERHFVEDCFFLRPKDALMGLRVDKIVGKENTNTTNKPGELYLWFEEDLIDPNIVHVSVNGNEPQKLVLEYINATYGQRCYLICNCGHRVAKLHLTPHGKEFRCRVCLNLRYRISVTNSRSIAGGALHNFSRISKLMEMRERIDRIFYRGRFTKRYKRFLMLCGKAGLNSEVDRAQNLLETIKSH